MSPIARQVGTRYMMVYHSEADEELKDLDNLECLTMGIPNMAIDEVPKCYQCHTVDVSEWVSRLLHRMGHAIACYDAQQED